MIVRGILRSLEMEQALRSTFALPLDAEAARHAEMADQNRTAFDMRNQISGAAAQCCHALALKPTCEVFRQREAQVRAASFHAHDPCAFQYRLQAPAYCL